MLELVEIFARDTLKGVNLSARQGELVVVIGANGTGKTTLFNVIAGSACIKSGKIMLGSKDITGLPQHKRAMMIASVMQNPQDGTIGDMTLLENLSIAYVRGRKRMVTRRVVEDFRARLATLGMNLENRLHEYAQSLSGGQRQLLSLIMAISSDYELLLLDEITAALDQKTSDTVMNMTMEIVAQEGKTCLLITHDAKYINKIGDRTLEVADGKLVELR
jgi:putative ABC transport system ATP-binding protein